MEFSLFRHNIYPPGSLISPIIRQIQAGEDECYTHASSETHESHKLHIFTLLLHDRKLQHTQETVLSTLFHMRKLTGPHDWLLLWSLKGDRVYANLPIKKEQPILLSWMHGHG